MQSLFGGHIIFKGKPELTIEAYKTRHYKAFKEVETRAVSVGDLALPEKAYAEVVIAAQSAKHHPAIAPLDSSKVIFRTSNQSL